MNRKALLLSIAATLAGVLLMRMHLQRLEQRVAGGPAHDVLMVTRDARSGARIDRALLSVRAIPEGYRDSRHIDAADLPQVLDARLGVDVRASEPLLWTDLRILRERPRTLAALVPEGMRAFAVRAHSMAALIVPGDRVDVIASRAQDDGARASATLAQHVLVLSVGENLGEADERDAARRRAGDVTLSVTPAQSRRLAEVEHTHELRLLLRNPADVALVEPDAEAAAMLTTGDEP